MGTASASAKEVVHVISSDLVPLETSKIRKYLDDLFPESALIAVVCAPSGKSDVFNIVCEHGSRGRALQPLNSRNVEFKGGNYVLREGLKFSNLLVLVE